MKTSKNEHSTSTQQLRSLQSSGLGRTHLTSRGSRPSTAASAVRSALKAPLTAREKQRRKEANLCAYCGKGDCPGREDTNLCPAIKRRDKFREAKPSGTSSKPAATTRQARFNAIAANDDEDEPQEFHYGHVDDGDEIEATSDAGSGESLGIHAIRLSTTKGSLAFGALRLSSAGVKEMCDTEQTFTAESILQKNPPLRTKTEYAGNTYSALIDSCADISILTKDFPTGGLKRVGRLDCGLVSASGSTIINSKEGSPILQLTYKITDTGTTLTDNFIVADVKISDAIVLGRDWLMTRQPHTDWSVL